MMMLQLVLVCCLVGQGMGDNTLHFVPHSQQAPVSKDFSCPVQTRCPVGNTCCQVSDNSQFGCCPHKNGSCCADKIHCCPEGMTCDLSARGCVKKGRHSPSLFKHPLTRINAAHYEGKTNICPDDTECSDESTCCPVTAVEYGCCPLPMAVCCSDHVHCCPSGTTCDVAGGTCNRAGLSFPWMDKTPSLARKLQDKEKH